MQRYDYVTMTHVGKYGDEYTYFMVFDRSRGCTLSLADCDSRDDAEMIVRALTALETLAQPSNHNTIEPQNVRMEIAA
jgi:hypothetical protein